MVLFAVVKDKKAMRVQLSCTALNPFYGTCGYPSLE